MGGEERRRDRPLAVSSAEIARELGRTTISGHELLDVDMLHESLVLSLEA